MKVPIVLADKPGEHNHDRHRDDEADAGLRSVSASRQELGG